MVDGLLTVKEYAEIRHKSVQAVYKQMKSKENAAALEGHVHTRKVNNRDVQCLDEEAIRILNAASGNSVQVVLQTEDKERIAELEQEKQQLLIKIAELQDALIREKDKVQLLQEQNTTLQLEAAKVTPAEPDLPQAGFWARVFGKKKNKGQG